MWNRFLLLASGLATGWTLVNLLTVPPEEIRRQASWLLMGAALGLVVVGWLALDSLTAGLVGLAMLGFCALVAYAANAKQVSKVESPPSLPCPEPGDGQRGQTAVLLIFAGQPACYQGPGPWARQFRRREEANQPVPHWFLRPLAYRRIRAAYQKQGNRNPQQDAVEQIAATLQARLAEPYAVSAVLSPDSLVAEVVAQLAAGGVGAIVLVPIGFPASVLERLRGEVARSRVRELGVAVTYASALDLAPWSAATQEELFLLLSRGLPLPAPAPLPVDALTVMETAVRLALDPSARNAP